MSSENAITDQEFAMFQRLLYKLSGINLSDNKKVLLVGRLQKRLREFGFETYSQYYRLLASGQNPAEVQTMVDLMTTNETYFFRESKHFDFLRDEVLRKRSGNEPFRIWSAASSTGEEAYTMAMVLADAIPRQPWEVVGTDISTQVVAKARRGHYPLDRNEGIPPAFLSKYCLKGVRSQAGTFLMNSALRERVNFHHANLTHPLPAELGIFDVIFLRNVMIYFDQETKSKVVGHLVQHLKRGGYFIIGHSETLNGIENGLSILRPTIYQKN
jgi:chemotaxis protein methyltransferase CheR